MMARHEARTVHRRRRAHERAVARSVARVAYSAILLALAVALGAGCRNQQSPTGPASEQEHSGVIEDGKQVSIEYTLTLTDGTEVDTNVGGEPLVYTQGGGQILPALEEALAGLATDDTKKVSLSAEDGYGAVDPGLFREVEPTLVPEEARQVGALLMAGGDDGPRHPVRVHEVKEEAIVLDFNHPLAGQALVFEVKVTAVE